MSLLLAIRYEILALWFVPALMIGAFVAIVNFRFLFFLLVASIPISTEFQVTESYGTDLPTEPLMIVLMLIYWFYSVKNGVILRGGQFIRHPLTLLLLMHLGWIIITTLNSQDVFLSIKYTVAKTWYVITFYFLTGLLIEKERDFQTFAWYLFVPLFFAVLITITRQAASGFSFELVQEAMQPMFRNHVTYACITTISLPFVWMLWSWQPKGSWQRYWLAGAMVLFLVAIQFSYTRAAYVAVLGAVGYYFIVRFHLTKWIIASTSVALLVLLAYMYDGNRYLDFAPKFEKTITHERFDKLLEATTKGEDISTMERVNRWVAGVQMVIDKPFMGFGPNNFYNFYKPYMLTNFKTYVSDNPDHSTVHCYYLLVAIEQGFPGFVLFLVLVFSILLKGEQIYHRVEGKRKQAVMAALLSFMMILTLNIINDMIETDKVGSFFFMTMAMLVNIDIGRKSAF